MLKEAAVANIWDDDELIVDVFVFIYGEMLSWLAILLVLLLLLFSGVDGQRLLEDEDWDDDEDVFGVFIVEE